MTDAEFLLNHIAWLTGKKCDTPQIEMLERLEDIAARLAQPTPDPWVFLRSKDEHEP